MKQCRGPCKRRLELRNFYITLNRGKYRMRNYCKKCENARRSASRTATANDKQIEVIQRLAELATTCNICGAKGSNHGRGRLCIDFTKSGEHRGYLCLVCNRVVGMFKQSSKRFAMATAYLSKGNK